MNRPVRILPVVGAVGRAAAAVAGAAAGVDGGPAATTQAPDPEPGGGFDMWGVDSDTPKFKAAMQACRQLAEPAKGGK